MIRNLILAGAIVALMSLGSAHAAETLVGKPVVKNGMIINASYLQPVHMSPALPGMDRAADIHLEADIHADKDNAQGFQPGDWIPYLTVSYRLGKQGSEWNTFGSFMAMTASDGPHYGRNVKLDGPGKYTLTLNIEPPPYAGFFRHTSKQTGVAAWWSSFTVSWTFVWAGNGKLGGY